MTNNCRTIKLEAIHNLPNLIYQKITISMILQLFQNNIYLLGNYHKRAKYFCKKVHSLMKVR